MAEPTWTSRIVAGARQAVGLGWIAGSLEVVALASGLRLALSSTQMAVLGLVDVALMGALGGLIGALVGLPLHRLFRQSDPTQTGSVQLGLSALALCGFFLWQGAFTVWGRGQPVASVAMALIPLGFGGVVYFNARYWLRRAALGRSVPVPWWAASGGLTLAIVLGAAALYPQRATGGIHALDGDRSLLMVTLDGVRPEDRLTALDTLADGGVRFLDAVSPSPHTAPAHGTVFTGLHPLRHHLVRERGALRRGLQTLPEIMEREGYATGGFVSTERLGARAGFDQGWRVFDDDRSLGIAGLHRVNLIGWIRQWVGGSEVRAAEQTVERFLHWLDGHHALPFLGWVQLSGETEALDRALHQILDGLETHGLTEEIAVWVVGSHGRLEAGEEGALRDRAVRVPMVMRLPGVEVNVPEVEPQVRLTDLTATALDWLGLSEPGETEGVSLLGYARGERGATMWSALIAEDPQGQFILGMRNNGLKYVRSPDGTERLYDLRADPQEAEDLSVAQPSTLEQARLLMSSEVAALARVLAEEGR